MARDPTATARVAMLDNSIHNYDVKLNSYGNALLQLVMKDLNLLEADYFGILYKDKNGVESFLDPLKKIKLQILNISGIVLKFVVKCFPPDPGQLHEEYTRYLFALQVKRDFVEGLLPCNKSTVIDIASYIIQAEVGDWDESTCGDLTYLKELNFFPSITEFHQEDLLSNIVQKHKVKAGLTPADADRQLLDIVRRSEHYGIRLHPARDQENADISLSVAHMGVVIFRGSSKINTFNWARIRKLSFKKKHFLVKLRADADVNNRNRNAGDVLIFMMKSRDACKSFWKHCLEYHAFFRLENIPAPKPKAVVLKRGSTFAYSGKTQKELDELVRNSNFRRTAFVRASSRKSARPGQTSWTSGSPHAVALPSLPSSDVDNDGQDSDEQNSTGVALTSIRSDEAPNGHISKISEDAVKKEGCDETWSGTSESWQVKSEHLHSSVVVTSDVAAHPTGYNEADLTTMNAEKTQSSPTSSPVHLHSGGSTDVANNNGSGTGSENMPALSPSSSMHSPTGFMSTRGLRSTSSLNSESKYPASQAYYIAKEVLTTERTYVKDLEVINKDFKNAIMENDVGPSLIPENVANQLFGGTGSLLSIHQQFLADLEDRLSSWEDRTGELNSVQRVDDVILKHLLVLGKYLESLENGQRLISALEDIGARDPRFESAYRDFELQKVCYLPFSSFLLKPMQRIVHYKTILDNLVSLTNVQNQPDIDRALIEVKSLMSDIQQRLITAHNIQKMAQLKRDLLGVDLLLNPSRKFIREGSLYKLSRKGFQQRLFFLFSDCLLYTSKGVTSTNQFKVNAELPLQGMIIEINEGESAVPNCFSILSGSKTVIVAAAGQEEMNKWLEDFSSAIAIAGREIIKYESPLTNANRGSSNRLSIEQSSEDGDGSARNSREGLKIPTQQRSNATMHVCWHRNTSVSASDHLVSLKNQLSGYLLRKFKNSNGWQKLWVVFSNFCLFFYKSHQDESPLASLPLLGYTINSPSESDGIRKDFVCKLQFKTHVYFFRAESQYTYNRWLQVISSATVTSQRTRLFSRMDSCQ